LKPSTFDLEEQRLKREVKRRKSKLVLIQLPEGLKPQGPRIAEIVESVGATAIVSADPCYGACDLAVEEAKSLGADLLVHFGHSPLSYTDKPVSVPVVYIEVRAKLRLEATLKKALPIVKSWKRIGLVTTVQHVEHLNEARETLQAAGKSVVVGNVSRLGYAGQVLGCDFGNAQIIAKDVEAFVCVCGGRFHAVGVALATSKPTVAADPYEIRAYSVDQEADRIKKQRWASMREAAKGQRFGILIGLKSDQKRLERALQISKKLQQAKKKPTLLAVREVTPESLLQYPSIDAYVNTACPRISLDDSTRFRKPVLTVNETLVVTGELTWEQLLRKGWFED
jgi:2-(3-amino-3-carboxypropyl)histidine synthase